MLLLLFLKNTEMKKILFFTLAILLICCKPKHLQNNVNILQSQNIIEIENFLKTIHPDDPKRNILRSRLIKLKNVEWTKGRKDAKPMQSRTINSVNSNMTENYRVRLEEAKEYDKLITSSSQEHKNKTVKILNTMFNEDVNNNEVILLVKNNSKCNLILRIKGKNSYNMPVPANAENAIIIDKGSYTLTSNVCNSMYTSHKVVRKSTHLVLSL